MDESPPPSLLPELWLCVFRFLSAKQKHTVRRCSRSLRDLVDHPCLWRNHAVTLHKLRRYSSGFWRTLRRRQLTRVATRSLRSGEWELLAASLPSLRAVALTRTRSKLSQERYLRHLPLFPQLREVAVRNATWDGALLSPSVSEQLRGRLTHLSVCNVGLSDTAGFVDTVSSHLVNLRFLLFHPRSRYGYVDDALEEEEDNWETARPVPKTVFHKLLLNVKKLQHLSWGFAREPREPLPDDYLCPVQPGSSQYAGPELTSLELVDYPETMLPQNALRHLTSLRSLTVRYICGAKEECQLGSWVEPLKQLETLAIVGGNSLASYTSALPVMPSLTRLTLRVTMTLKQLDAVAPKFPALEHLDVDQNCKHGKLCRRIALQFPELRSLRIRYIVGEPSEDLLSLSQLRRLKRLELLVERPYNCKDHQVVSHWPCPAGQELIEHLRALSANAISVITARRRRDPWRDCDCVWKGDYNPRGRS